MDISKKKAFLDKAGSIFSDFNKSIDASPRLSAIVAPTLIAAGLAVGSLTAEAASLDGVEQVGDNGHLSKGVSSARSGFEFTSDGNKKIAMALGRRAVLAAGGIAPLAMAEGIKGDVGPKTAAFKAGLTVAVHQLGAGVAVGSGLAVVVGGAYGVAVVGQWAKGVRDERKLSKVQAKNDAAAEALAQANAAADDSGIKASASSLDFFYASSGYKVAGESFKPNSSLEDENSVKQDPFAAFENSRGVLAASKSGINSFTENLQAKKTSSKEMGM